MVLPQENFGKAGRTGAGGYHPVTYFLRPVLIMIWMEKLLISLEFLRRIVARFELDKEGQGVGYQGNEKARSEG